MRAILLLFALGGTRGLDATDVSGTWFGTWQRQDIRQGVCLYLLDGQDSIQGRITYGHDTKSSSIDAKSPLGNTVEFGVLDSDRGKITFRLTVSDTTFTGTATDGKTTESIALKKYTVPRIYYRYGKGREDPVPIGTAKPEYTPETRAAGLQGVVSLSVPVESSGAVGGGVKVVRGLGLGLDEKAVECVKKWRFTPPHWDCSAGPVYVRIDVQFVLPAQ